MRRGWRFRYTVRYIPLSKLQAGDPVPVNRRLRELNRLFWDSLHLLIVRKNRKTGEFVVISGQDRYAFLRKHTNKKFAPCLVDESPAAASAQSLISRVRNRRLLQLFPHVNPSKLTPPSLAVIRAFLRQEPRFRRLPRGVQLRVLLLGVRYKQTVLRAMRDRVDEHLS